MKRLNEAANYTGNKHEIFEKLVNSIEEADQQNLDKIYLKNIKILEEDIDVIATREEWPTVLEKALAFFVSIEAYEMCHRCLKLSDKLKQTTIPG